MNDSDNLFCDDSFLREKEDISSKTPTAGPKWKVMVVDDEEEVHRMTTAAMRDFMFEDMGLDLIFASSAGEAKFALNKHPDTALIILDVVMETEHAGLEVVRYIRQTLNNKFMRIILRTGQPGMAPENDVIINYDINDYKAKSELTIQRLYTSVVTCLRSYSDLIKLDDACKKLEKEAQRRILMEKQLAEREYQAAVGMAITQIVHGAKNILSALKGGQYMINAALKNNDSELLIKGWDAAQTGISRMAALTGDLLDVSRFNQIELKVGSIPSLVEDIIGMFQDEDRAVEVSGDIDKSTPPILFDYEAIHTALMNLVSNAIDACTAREYDSGEKARVLIRVYSADGFVNIDVEDNGQGISENDMDKIFVLFFSTKNFRGNGLGLPITKKIVEGHGGALEVTSQKGSGTTFLIRLPLKDNL
ncbi:MAG: hybrid sensor histidine kinase/response regulator [Candidatus Magnetominusculus sp. LBB02]|nr:hybrid sensor histidine kinase/response regulator [Candidatus Magnetominusculus sp. LBB02]